MNLDETLRRATNVNFVRWERGSRAGSLPKYVTNINGVDVTVIGTSIYASYDDTEIKEAASYKLLAAVRTQIKNRDQLAREHVQRQIADGIAMVRYENGEFYND